MKTTLLSASEGGFKMGDPLQCIQSSTAAAEGSGPWIEAQSELAITQVKSQPVPQNSLHTPENVHCFEGMCSICFAYLYYCLIVFKGALHSISRTWLGQFWGFAPVSYHEGPFEGLSCGQSRITLNKRASFQMPGYFISLPMTSAVTFLLSNPNWLKSESSWVNIFYSIFSYPNIIFF